jgi:hypothetical protein
MKMAKACGVPLKPNPYLGGTETFQMRCFKCSSDGIEINDQNADLKLSFI